ncbi:hypothetical protein [Spirillospora albida]|uniref:hypothetical protein n=1 Tax=Spirillospora albida TaxID=58123 RepID=UPI00068FB287|nr:hypothetical protein [Spirillospora albida]
MPFLLALAGGAVLRWTAVRAYPNGLWFTGDSYFYLGYALRPSPSPSKTLGYPFLLRLLEPLHSLTAIVAVQHLMGLAVAGLAYALLCRAGLPAWAGTLVTLPLLYDAYQVELEHLLMSETLFTFLIMAALTLLLWRTGAPGDDPPVPPWWAAAAAGLLIGYAVLVRSAGVPLVPAVLLWVLLRRRAGTRRPRWLTAAAWRPALAFGAAAALPLAAYAAWFHSQHGVYALTSTDGLYLWGRTASFADCAKIDPPAEQVPLCLDERIRAEGDAPGHLIWRGDIPPRRVFDPVAAPEANAALRGFAVRAILAQPGDYLRTVGAGIGMAFDSRRHPHPTAGTEALYHFPARPHVFPGGRSLPAGGTARSDAVHFGGEHPSRVVRPHADRMIAYQERWYLPGPALGALFAAGAAGVLLARRRRREVLLAWGTGATLLVFPIASADFDYRYVVPAMPFACLAAGLALASVPRVSRWSGTPGSRPRGSGPATAP